MPNARPNIIRNPHPGTREPRSADSGTQTMRLSCCRCRAHKSAVARLVGCRGAPFIGAALCCHVATAHPKSRPVACCPTRVRNRTAGSDDVFHAFLSGEWGHLRCMGASGLARSSSAGAHCPLRDIVARETYANAVTLRPHCGSLRVVGPAVEEYLRLLGARMHTSGKRFWLISRFSLDRLQSASLVGKGPIGRPSRSNAILRTRRSARRSAARSLLGTLRRCDRSASDFC